MKRNSSTAKRGFARVAKFFSAFGINRRIRAAEALCVKADESVRMLATQKKLSRVRWNSRLESELNHWLEVQRTQVELLKKLKQQRDKT